MVGSAVKAVRTLHLPTSVPMSLCVCTHPCREEIAAFNDPTIMHKLQMQLAIAEERFEDATT